MLISIAIALWCSLKKYPIKRIVLEIDRQINIFKKPKYMNLENQIDLFDDFMEIVKKKTFFDKLRRKRYFYNFKR